MVRLAECVSDQDRLRRAEEPLQRRERAWLASPEVFRKLLVGPTRPSPLSSRDRLTGVERVQFLVGTLRSPGPVAECSLDGRPEL